MAGTARLAGKRAVATGTGCGIGRAIAIAFAHEGALVLCADIDDDSARETVSLVAAKRGRAPRTARSPESPARFNRPDERPR